MNVMAQLSASAESTRFSADEFQRMMASGAFEDMWVELIDGGLRRMPPPGREHGRLQMAVIAELLRIFSRRLVFGDVAIDLGGDTILACDAALIRDASATGAVLGADEVVLVVEVAVSTRDHDLGLKRRLYAAADIPAYWVVDAERAIVHVFERPEGGDYMGLSLVRFGEPLALPGTEGAIVLE